MKKIYIIFLFTFLIINNSCDEVLDVLPENIVQDEAVFSTEAGIEAYLASLYDNLPLNDLSIVNWGTGQLSNLTTVSLNPKTVDPPSLDNQINGLNKWGSMYSVIRSVSNFIGKISKSSLSTDEINGYLGEAKFLRAYYYFGLVELYGGVPLITEVQTFTGGNLSDLQVPRAKEQDVYDYISKELDEAAELMGETSELGRANKYVALTLKSRAMLYAASSAEYAPVLLDGFVGIAPSEADRYWEAAYDAAKQVIESGKYSLYNENSDKTLNFQELFLNTDNNPEAIYVKAFKYPDKSHRYDLIMLPYSQRSPLVYSSNCNPTLEFVNQFEYVDGSSGELKLTDIDGNPIEYQNPTDLFIDKDPRFLATVIAPFTTWRGNVIEIRAGIIDGTQTIPSSGEYSKLHKGINIMGEDGPGRNDGLGTYTGFYVRKYLNPEMDRSSVAFNSDQDFIALRYGELLLNYAEAAYESDKKADATWAINQIRERAGIKLLIESEVTQDKIRHERMVELAFENLYFFDLKRWRTAHEVLSNTTFTALEPYLVLHDGGENGYIYKTKKVGYPKTFFSYMYYLKISDTEMNSNPNLVQNPSY
jgi:hypothetical protein